MPSQLQATQLARKQQALYQEWTRNVDGKPRVSFPRLDDVSRRILIAALGVSAAAVALGAVHAGRLRVLPVENVLRALISRRAKLRGLVVSVGHRYKFRMLHQPRLRAHLSLEQLPKELKKATNTIFVRLAGVDAPDCAIHGIPEQLFGPEAREWLRNKLEGRLVTVQLLKKDQYNRVIASVQYRNNWWQRPQDISLELIRAGYAVVERGKDAVYNGAFAKYEAAEKAARAAGVGVWKNAVSVVVGVWMCNRATLGSETINKYATKAMKSEES